MKTYKYKGHTFSKDPRGSGYIILRPNGKELTWGETIEGAKDMINLVLNNKKHNELAKTNPKLASEWVKAGFPKLAA